MKALEAARAARRELLPAGARAAWVLIRGLGGRTTFLLILAALVGAASGYVAILFRELIHLVNRLAYPGGILSPDLAALPWYALLALPALGGLLVGPLVHLLAREAKGHGVPEVMDAVAHRGGRIRHRVAAVKLVASAISIGVGASVGREGPIVQVGSSLGSSVAQLLHLDTREVKLLVACGAAAGIAATFNAPIAGTIFAIEIILGSATIAGFTPLVVAAVISTAISRFHLGDAPAFSVPRYAVASAADLGLCVGLGLCAAGVAVTYTRGLYWMEDLWDRLPLHPLVRPVVGGLCVGGMALLFPQVMGMGYDSIELALAGDARAGALLLAGLVVAKMLATQVSIASGFSGGIFAPALFIGAMLGGAFGQAVGALAPTPQVAASGAWAVIGMGAVVAATLHAPLSSILIVFEMTGDYRMILPLMLACYIATIAARRLSPHSIYTLKLARRGVELTPGSQGEILRETPVATLMHDRVATAHADTPFAALLQTALAHDGSVIFVTGADGRLRGRVLLEELTGLVRDQDVVGSLVVADDLSHPPRELVHPQESLATCVAHLSLHGREEIPVVDDDGRLVGALERADLVDFYHREVLRRGAASLSFTGG